MKRLFDIVFAVLIVIPCGLVFVILWGGSRLTAGSPVLYWSARVGKDNKVFQMPKFRTMVLNTPQVATHLLADPGRHFTRIGKLLRKTSLDEIPQLYCILKGDMSFVGPRPALFNQLDLIELRTSNGVHALTPGLTGWAQINGRDELALAEKVKLDVEYLDRRNTFFDLTILFATVGQVLSRRNVSH